MELRKEEFPVALQAYEVRGDREDFLAEQVVSTQTEADTFMSMYAGRLIKTREVRPVETKHYAHEKEGKNGKHYRQAGPHTTHRIRRGKKSKLFELCGL